MKTLITVIIGIFCISCEYTLRLEPLSFIEKDNSNVINDKNCPLGMPISRGKISLIGRDGYTSGYSDIHKTSIWVCEEMTKEELVGNARRKNRFLPDPTIPRNNRAELSDYKNSGYDRGHLAAADNYKNDQRLNDETFFLSNISPQIHSFNAGIWKRFEQKIRDWVKQYGKIYVITGPLYFENSHEALESSFMQKFIGKNKVGVPSHFYKILVKDEKDISILAFVIRHEASSSKVQLNTFLTSVDWIEKNSEINFLPALPVTREYLESRVGEYW
ncbi:DNA/RNA non-specific endonuclease [Leptospira sarikeiensis]|uniref:DNA/RNA non-specific endonuclease n=1 Tax=Leptospira sarikeiensis TaxID=2484943 RepID=A0A4R9K2Z4_9LEPT|nr:DNA/RNA non-specific endonuclease [Leptospira sarikeiensis]TGL59516.1 DNA/RNA non-specific endonuclease [Leptospira sarikeiensis]